MSHSNPSTSSGFANRSMAGTSTSLRPNTPLSRQEGHLATPPQLESNTTSFPFARLPEELRKEIWRYTAQHSHRIRLFARRPCERQHFPSPYFNNQRWAPAMTSSCAESIREACRYYFVCVAKDSSKLTGLTEEEFEETEVNVNFDVDVFVLQAAGLVDMRSIGDGMYNFNADVFSRIRFLEIDFHEKNQTLQDVSSLNLFRLATKLEKLTLAVRVDRISSRSTMMAALSNGNLRTHLKVRQYLGKLARGVKEKAMADSQEVIDFGAQALAIPVRVGVSLKLYGLGDSPASILASVEECLTQRFLLGH